MATIPSRPGRAPRWRRRLALLVRSRRLVAMVEIATLLVMLAMWTLTWFALGRWTSSERPLSPPFVALLLVANLVPAMGLMVLLARRFARARAEASPLGSRDGFTFVLWRFSRCWRRCRPCWS